MTRLFISRSGEQPLDVDLGYRLAVVAPYTNRLRTLSCRGCTVEDLSNFSNCPAPFLETLHILLHDYLGSGSSPLPTLFNCHTPSLRELVINGHNPWPNNHFRDLSSLHLRLSSGDDALALLTPLLAMLRDNPQLEEFFLRQGITIDNLPPSQGEPTSATLHALQGLHLCGVHPILTRQFLGLVDLSPNGIAMQFTNITPKLDHIFPHTFPLELSLQAVTSREIIYLVSRGLIIQGKNPGVQIKVAGDSDLEANHGEIFSYLVRRTSPQLPLRELWIHIKRKKEYKLPPLPLFNCLEKLVVRVTTNGNPIRRLLQMLDVHEGRVPCPLLSILDLSGVLIVAGLLKVLKARSKAGCRLETLRLGKTHDRAEDVAALQDCADEVELFDVDAEPCGMELPTVCTTETGELWEPWTKHHIRFL
jgi:hypothetical protein